LILELVYPAIPGDVDDAGSCERVFLVIGADDETGVYEELESRVTER